MKQLYITLKIIDTNIIYCLIPMILTNYSIEKIYPNKFETKKFLTIIRWSIIV